MRDNAVEIFLTNGRTLLLAFDNTKVNLALLIDTFLDVIMEPV